MASKALGGIFWDDLGGEPAWQDGRMIILQGGNFTLGMYDGENPPKHEWELARFPQGPSSTNAGYSTYYGNWLMIPAGTKNLEQAFAFVDWFNGEGVMHWVTSGSADAPGSRMFYKNNPDYVTPMVKKHLGEERARSIMAFFQDQAEHAIDMFGSPIASFQWDQASRAAERVLKKAASAAEALKEAQDACAAELEKILKGS